MRSKLHLSRREFGVATAAGLLATQASGQQASGIPVPGTGVKVEKVGDDFEDANWKYVYNGQKSSDEQDHQQRLPAGASKNNRWFEPIMRGQPDKIERVPTPKGGIEGSEGSMYLASIYPGIPGRPSNKVEQDDFCANCVQAMGGRIQISSQPQTVVRVYVPAISQWENRNGASFGYRLGLRAQHEKLDKRGRSEGRLEEYWPGMFLRMESRTVDVKATDDKPAERKTERYIQLTVRANERGHDQLGPKLAEKAWYTLGMTCTADGRVHYFVREGVEDLRASDRIASHYPYGFRASQFETFFFDVIGRDTGSTWSTPWVVDDAFLYLTTPPRGFQQGGRR
jgi:hypothetical protein